MDLFAELFVETLGLTIPGYFILQVWLAKSWSGRWRLAALAPLIFIGPAILFSLYALSRGSNLWPLTIVFLAPVGFVYLLAAWGTRTAVES
jgi:membrane-associated PAP2 superfamily phosphatase